ncbi:hypothetical protein J3459_010338 [Metarhizium acridum]|nr:hypothetical protein J3459_010338 [Metarhizium acridum]
MSTTYWILPRGFCKHAILNLTSLQHGGESLGEGLLEVGIHSCPNKLLEYGRPNSVPPSWDFCGKAGAPHQQGHQCQTVYLQIPHNRNKPPKQPTEFLRTVKSRVLYYYDSSLAKSLYIASPFRSSKEGTHGLLLLFK